MKPLALLSILTSLSFAQSTPETHKEMNDLIKTCALKSEMITKQYIEEASGSHPAQLIAPLEKDTGDAWQNFYQFVIESKDPELKRLLLECELRNNLLDAIYQDDREAIASAKKNLAMLKELAKPEVKKPTEEAKENAE